MFGFTVTFIALLQGFEAQPTPEGVASATTRTVVVASLAVLGLDFILTAMMFTYLKTEQIEENKYATLKK